MSKSPKVSIVAIAYNQENYIREALDSFAMQNTDFVFEVIVADDCSTDKTAEIIKEYVQNHPTIFKPILRKKNIGAVANCIDTLKTASGKYIALCEGDDYWTDPEKLQRQVGFLDSNPGYALCFHPVKVITENQEGGESVYPEPAKIQKFTTEELLKQNFIQTNSVMYRKQDYQNLPANILPLDWYFHLYHAQFGKIGFIDRVMAAYRRHPESLWWDAEKNIDEIWKKYGILHLNLYIELLKIYGKYPSYRKILEQSVNDLLNTFIQVDEKHGENLVEKSFREFPNYAAAFVVHKDKDLHRVEQQLQNTQQELNELKLLTHHKDKQIEEIQRQIDLIKNSKTWKTRNKAAKLMGKKVV